MRKFFTIGMAGHIDHGKTTLTKALTGVETDRLKEEKRRKISIEPGFAPLIQLDDLQISIIDVPGHERFIRQMIAGVAGIDFVVLVVAANEGMMPQTREHLAILSLLGVERGIIAVTKVDSVEQGLLELIQIDIDEAVKGTFLETSPVYYVDSVSQKGIKELKEDLINEISELAPHSTAHSFRLPIDAVFTVKGQGVVVRGTVFNGSVRVGDEVTVLPNYLKGRIRQIESHHTQMNEVVAGQRAALNLSHISHHELSRGDVLVKDDFYTPTIRIDVALTMLEHVKYPVKQRQQIKLYIGTSEVVGNLIFFDRNKLQSDHQGEVLCQIKLDQPVVTVRNDRFIVRRTSPVETIGGGWVIEPNAKRHRFGELTMTHLQQLKDGSAKDRVMTLLSNTFAQSASDIKRIVNVTEAEFTQIKHELIEIKESVYTKFSVVQMVIQEMKKILNHYHETYPLHHGMNRAEFFAELTTIFPTHLVDYTLTTQTATELIYTTEKFVSLHNFTPSYPTQWKKRIEQVMEEWEKQGANLEKMVDLFTKHQIPKSLHEDLYYYLIHSNCAYEFDEGRLIAQTEVVKLKNQLLQQTNRHNFTLQEARSILELSRKNLVPLLELFDRLNYTKRLNNERVWLI